MSIIKEEMQKNLKERIDSIKDGRRLINKIWISGGPGVGKTALIHGLIGELKWRDKTVEWIDEVIRDSPFPADKGATFETEIWIVETQHAKELQKTKFMPEFLLCDRGIVDVAVYSTMLFNDKKMPEKQYNWILRAVLDWIKTYDFGIVVSPSDREITSDGFRATDKSYQWEMHDYFISVLDAIGAEYIIVKGSHEDRIKHVLEHLKKKEMIH